MKKNCNGCRALSVDECMLNKEITFGIREVGGLRMRVYIPKEECPKPLTYKALFDAMGM